ncbi:MAG TPA: hypothetical protein VHZ74_26095 [Bryobacteraceae bacterium]|jgi:hypothetical protein|nr:hypothetical protein [Bryobacteraceae bacterium]
MTKAEFALSRLGIPLSWLAELDNVPVPNGLTDALGDRYLCRHSPVFAAIRQSAIDFGYRFSAADTPLWRDYQCCSLASLDRILGEKTIPYLDTGTTFRRLVEAHPNARVTPRFIRGSVRRNFTFHESAHCVAHSILQAAAAELRALEPNEGRRGVLEGILAESFANTVEVLAQAFSHMTLSDSVFHSLNSYHSFKPEREALLNAAAAEIGTEARFSVLVISYFEANLTAREPDETIFARVARASECDGKHVLQLAESAFGLHAGFRESTTPAWFELMGLSGEYNALAKEGWLDHPSNQHFVRGLARQLWGAAGSV